MGTLTESSSSGRLRSIAPPPPTEPWPHEIWILEPLGPELGIAFWRMLRRARMWSMTPADARRSLAVSVPEEACRRLGDACVHAPELVDAFGLFALSIRSPEAVEPRHLVDASRRICRWAEARSHLPTAALFAEAAASINPDSAELASDAARLCRQVASFGRAASWYERAFGLAVRTRDRQEVVKALLGYGNLMKDIGEFEKARVVFERVARRALHTGRRRVAAEAHHSLLTLAAESGMFQAAVRHLRKALDYYPVHHPFIPYLVHDFAFVLVRNRYYGLAVGPLTHLLSVIQKPHEQVLVYGTLARAAGGIRSRQQYRDAEEAILRLSGQHQQFAASALNGLAEGAWAFGDWEQAAAHASAALSVACTREDGAEQRVAEEILESVSKRVPAPLEMDPEGRQRTEFLLQRLLSRLRAWEAPTRGASHAVHSPAA
jgi:tetratricopeptide (TPR) repeat protein